MGFLDAYRVVDFTNERGLLAGRLLADLGADVIQVEPFGGSSARGIGPFAGGGESLYWAAYAANKRGVTCDLESSEGHSIDHLGFRVDNLDATLQRLKKDGVKILSPTRALLDGKIKFAFIEGPDHIKIEVIEDRAN